MKITLLWVGKTKDPNLGRLIGEYQKRIRHFLELSAVEIKPVEGRNPGQALTREGERILDRLDDDDFLVLLDPGGTELTTEQFAEIIRELRNRGVRNLVFVAGSHWGVSSEVKSRANRLLSLSRLTLTHEMARLVIAEQVYRALTVLHGVPYHK